MFEANDSDETEVVTELRVRARALAGAARGLMIWFTAISAVIVLGAVAGTTWNQHKRRPRGTTVTR